MPEVDLQIKADPVQLKAFLNAIKTSLCPNESKEALQSNTSKLNSLSNKTKVTAIENVTKLVITERAGFATKGFPRTLKELSINEVGCSQMPIGILNLTNLNFLDLTCNNITRLPKALGRLKLSKLVLDQNQLGDSTFLRDWDWLTGDNIQRSLTSLSIAKNKLKFVPPSLFKCSNLVQLDLSTNEVTKISFAIKNLNRLKILSLSGNGISSLPFTITKLYFDAIDLSSNQMPSDAASRLRLYQGFRYGIVPKFRSLLELSANAIIKHQIPFLSHNIPQITKDILMYSPLCVNTKCESLCFDRPAHPNSTLIQVNAKKRVTTDNSNIFLADGPLCSAACGRTVFSRFNSFNIR